MNDDQFRQLLNRFEFSWLGYRKVRKGVKKRINRYMKILGFRNMVSFLEELDKSDEIRHQCELLMAVSISRFFRDQKLWWVLKEKILPELLEKGRERIKVWSAGCACGEEVYSFKIIWDCLNNCHPHLPGLEIMGTDLNPVYLDRARNGIYPTSSLKEVTEEIRSRYFIPKESKKQFEVKRFLKEGITWEIQHLLYDQTVSDFDIVFLRNSVLTYYEDRLKKRAFRNVLDRLRPSGVLIIGSHEAIPSDTPGLNVIEPYSYIFRKAIKESAVPDNTGQIMACGRDGAI